ncbi:hypothetical protein EXIGLDRAFT_478414 [Exidia glandulosa HHB12029]|uniref:Uncharacterized protein n=1 Tax=Exidia glandulosa HHB12029 TaxID=1314781 RepID=A0A166AUI8_EXIGL|nr:hypothetical protein EXIGLDRAFT_478414 [Exidia glandulosa HHB12029]
MRRDVRAKKAANPDPQPFPSTLSVADARVSYSSSRPASSSGAAQVRSMSVTSCGPLLAVLDDERRSRLGPGRSLPPTGTHAQRLRAPDMTRTESRLAYDIAPLDPRRRARAMSQDRVCRRSSLQKRSRSPLARRVGPKTVMEGRKEGSLFVRELWKVRLGLSDRA